MQPDKFDHIQRPGAINRGQLGRLAKYPEHLRLVSVVVLICISHRLLWALSNSLSNSGDSYTSTGFDPSGLQPSRSNPIGNPAYPGDTKIGSPDWTNYLIARYNESFVKLFNFAYPGATIDDLVDPSSSGALSFRQQVENQFSPRYSNGRGGWTPETSLFAFWFGVNDVMLLNAKRDAFAYIHELTESYIGTIEKVST